MDVHTYFMDGDGDAVVGCGVCMWGASDLGREVSRQVYCKYGWCVQ